MFVAVRAVVFAVLFMGFVLVYAPLRLVLPPGAAPQLPLGWLGLVPLAVGLGITVWCIGESAPRGKAPPAVFDPPRRLVTRGLYRYVRNPMYLGASLILFGESAVYGSRDIMMYAASFLLI